MKEKLIELVYVRIQDATVPSDLISSALDLSLRAFNMVPIITYLRFDDQEILDMLADLLVTYAASVVLLRKDLATSVALYNQWAAQVKAIKESDSFFEDFTGA